MSLSNENTSVMNTLGETEFEDLSLQPTLQEVLDLQRQHVIESHTGFIEHTNADKTADEGVTLEEPLRVLRIELEELTGGTTNFRKNERDTPDLALVAKTVFASKLKLGIETCRLERATRDLVAVISPIVIMGHGCHQHKCIPPLTWILCKEKVAHVLLWFRGALQK